MEPLNLARVYIKEGLIQTEAPEALGPGESLQRSSRSRLEPPLVWRTRSTSETATTKPRSPISRRSSTEGSSRHRGADSTSRKDYRLLNQPRTIDLSPARFRSGEIARSRESPRPHCMSPRAGICRTLDIDPENVNAHWGLKQIYDDLGDEAKTGHHAALHATYKPDDNARDRAITTARQQYPAGQRRRRSGRHLRTSGRTGAFGLDKGTKP